MINLQRFSVFILGPQSKQRTPTSIKDSASRNRPRHHAPLRGRGVLHLQLPTVGRQQHRNLQFNQLLHNRPNNQHKQPPSHHQLQRKLHHLRDIR